MAWTVPLALTICLSAGQVNPYVPESASSVFGVNASQPAGNAGSWTAPAAPANRYVNSQSSTAGQIPSQANYAAAQSEPFRSIPQNSFVAPQVGQVIPNNGPSVQWVESAPGIAAGGAPNWVPQSPSFYGGPVATANMAPMLDTNYAFAGSNPPMANWESPGWIAAPADSEIWTFQLLPKDIMYQSYLASPKESRLAAQIVNETDHDALFDGWLGGRVGVFRYGTRDPLFPRGIQVDLEGAALLRLDIMNDVDVQSVDFRAGVPVTIGWGRHQTRLGYYHLSSHTGDEFLLKNPTHERLNFARDVLFIGHGYYITPQLRIFGELGWAFYTDVSKEWEFQTGFDYAPRVPTGVRGAPFYATHVHLREDVDWSGGFTFQAGWAWRGDSSTGLLRTGLQYFNGLSPQYSFYRQHEQQIGFGLWYDY